MLLIKVIIKNQTLNINQIFWKSNVFQLFTEREGVIYIQFLLLQPKHIFI